MWWWCGNKWTTDTAKKLIKKQLYFQGDIQGASMGSGSDGNTFLTTVHNVTSRRLSSIIAFDPHSLSLAPRKSFTLPRPSQTYKVRRNSLVIPESSPVAPNDDEAEGALTPAATPGTSEGGGCVVQGRRTRLPPLGSSATREQVP